MAMSSSFVVVDEGRVDGPFEAKEELPCNNRDRYGNVYQYEKSVAILLV